MRLPIVFAAFLFAVIVILAYGRFAQAGLLLADPNSIPGDAGLMDFALRRGAPLYAERCAGCHGARGHGDRQLGVPDLTDADWLYGVGTVSDIERVVAYGIRSDNPKSWNLAQMPAYARALPYAAEPKIPPLDPAAIRDLVEFLYYEQRRPADDAAASRGAAIYNGVGGCWDCHGADAEGDQAIGAPNLTDGITLYGDGSRQSLFDSIAYGHHGVCPAWAGRISSADIREISLYAYSLSHHPASHRPAAMAAKSP